jgi:hypothetical protein
LSLLLIVPYFPPLDFYSITKKLPPPCMKHFRTEEAKRKEKKGIFMAKAVYVDETTSTLISPFEVSAELLTPPSPAGNGTGGPVGDNAPTIIPPVILPPVILPPLGADVGVGFGWD